MPIEEEQAIEEEQEYNKLKFYNGSPMLRREIEQLSFLLNEYGFDHILSYILFVMKKEYWMKTCYNILKHIERFEYLYGPFYSEDKYYDKKENGDKEVLSKALPNYSLKYSTLFPLKWKEYLKSKEEESND